MDAILMAARLALAVVFLVAGAAKLADLAGSRQAAIDFGVPARLARLAGVALPLAEVTTAIAFVPRSTARWGAVAAFTLLSGFALAIANSLRKGERPDCHCFGQIHSAPGGIGTLVRDLILAAPAAALIAAGPGAPVPAVVAISVAGGLAVATLIALQLGLMLGLLRQNGRLLERIEQLEARADGRVLEPGVGTIATEVTLEAPNGETISTGAPGVPTLLVFADPGCGPCNALLPEIAAWRRPELRVAVISGGTEAEARAKREEHALDAVFADEERRAFAAFGIDGTPSGILIGADGRIAAPSARGAAAVRVLADRAAAGAIEPRESWILAAGDRLPRLGLIDADGARVELAADTAEPQSLLFFDPHCPHCRRLLAALQNAGVPEDLTIVVTRRTAPTELLELGARVLFDPNAQAMATAGIDATPSLLRLDTNARIASAPAVGGPNVLAALHREAVAR